MKAPSRNLIFFGVRDVLGDKHRKEGQRLECWMVLEFWPHQVYKTSLA